MDAFYPTASKRDLDEVFFFPEYFFTIKILSIVPSRKNFDLCAKDVSFSCLMACLSFYTWIILTFFTKYSILFRWNSLFSIGFLISFNQFLNIQSTDDTTNFMLQHFSQPFPFFLVMAVLNFSLLAGLHNFFHSFSF